MADGRRYEGRPLLRVLECYVLDAIGAISPGDSRAMVTITPRLSALLGRRGTWTEILVGELDLPSDLPSRIRANWDESVARAAGHGLALSPQQFAEAWTDRFIGA